MSSTDSNKDKELQFTAKGTGSSGYIDRKQLSVKPLPQNRPIATNVSEGTDELMGYLD
ncbi:MULTISPECIES: hypothetical protein [Moorena]|uniref:Uncharacterized protein n=2 Tax=Moorena producens TaxID=1155739 RepID=A0A9Q9STP0_MOOP1|nr:MULTISPECIES: hypothetical protein [Moorena]NES84069.1 hypothetical protein [Moorena sp. SIO2B7]EGJ28668.1 hypothetical protein LYNGBM3L_71180 [Moorena producens 3L]NEP31559.1 hypothetical protein [Moorena sp. SIO3B2]NEP68890.1 hypothetical protein [Moorena sp. SIO3A5]NEQ10053.1 hypothetical protein [Moorena sp. SIO4E2]